LYNSGSSSREDGDAAGVELVIERRVVAEAEHQQLKRSWMIHFSFLAEMSLANGLGDRSRVSSRSLITDALFSHTK
jgi:hypothetical protein